MAQNRILISAVVAVLLGFGFYNFGLKPKQKQAKDVAAKVTTAQGELSAAQALLASNQSARGTFKKAYSTVVRLGKAVPGDDDVRSLVVQLDESAHRAGVSFESINVDGATGAVAPIGDPAAVQVPPGATVGPAGFPIMPFSFEFKGQFFGLGDFFKRLDSYVKASNEQLGVTGRLLTVDGVKLEPDQTGFPNIRATVKATSYLVSPLEGPTGGATAEGPAPVPQSSAVDPTSSNATAMGAFR
jgi:hypothetical protein